MQASMVRALGESVSGGSVVAQETNVKSSLRTRSARALAAGALSVALLTSAAAAAFAADPAAPTPTRTPSMMKSPMTKSPMASPKPAAMASITIKANHTSVKTGHTVVFSGRATGLKKGTTLDLQRFNGKKWVTVKTTRISDGGPYSGTLKVTGTGKEKFRVVHSKTVSPTVTVTVTK